MKVFLGNTFTGRLDQQITDKIKAYGSWTYNSRYQRQPLWTVPQNSFFDTSLDISHNGQPYQSTWSAGNTWLASATLVNDMRASYYRENQPVASVAYGQDYSDKLGISGLPNTCMPSLGSFGFTEAINHACPSGNLQEIITLKDDVSKVWHNHAFKFGYELMRYRQDSWSVGSPDGTFTFAGTAGVSANGVNVANTGNTFANFLLGGVSSVAFSKQLQSLRAGRLEGHPCINPEHRLAVRNGDAAGAKVRVAQRLRSDRSGHFPVHQLHLQRVRGRLHPSRGRNVSL
jgi:hypothetical protein